ncbi:hypothetical protein PRZ48_014243 [Zasmidium cellare]|uniref:F-box domain-containing protein n=1 Tax=Zasmidium cellare TaxID=395010 RepID=A0ABR0E0E3_ZASCE|nr:hypothetical protein PRZ48_014243 [Zasmidium cellare]
MSTDTAAVADGVSANKVFAIPELFEMIVLEVDERTVLLSQRVSKTYRNNIKSSMKLQRKLWFQPTPIEDASKQGFLIQVNRLLLNPDIVWGDCHNHFYQYDDEGKLSRSESAFFTLITDAGIGPFVAKDGSWRQMLLAQYEGEVKCLALYADGDGKSLPFRNIRPQRRFGEGLTAGMFMDWMKEEWEAKYGKEATTSSDA